MTLTLAQIINSTAPSPSPSSSPSSAQQTQAAHNARAARRGNDAFLVELLQKLITVFSIYYASTFVDKVIGLSHLPLVFLLTLEMLILWIVVNFSLRFLIQYNTEDVAEYGAPLKPITRNLWTGVLIGFLDAVTFFLSSIAVQVPLVMFTSAWTSSTLTNLEFCTVIFAFLLCAYAIVETIRFVNN